MLKHPFIRRAKKNNILIELIERTADYKSRLGPSSDSDADDDAESQAGNDGWEYPTIRNTLDNNGVNHGRKPSADDDGTDTVRVTKNNRPSIKQQNDDISPNDTIVNHGANQTVAAIANQLKQSSIRYNCYKVVVLLRISTYPSRIRTDQYVSVWISTDPYGSN